MAIIAIELHRAVWSAKIALQVHCMVEFDRSRIATAIAQDREFRVAAIETRDVCREPRRRARGVKVRVALRTSDVRGDGKPQVAAMLDVARSADGCKGLIGVMQRSVVASAARLVGRLGTERIHLFQVARTALRREHSVCGGHFAAAIDAIVASERAPTQPQQRNRRNGYGKYGAQTPEGMRMLEIIQVDALRQFFCCEFGSGHDSSLYSALQ
jgi:hypothetical protein